MKLIYCSRYIEIYEGSTFNISKTMVVNKYDYVELIDCEDSRIEPVYSIAKAVKEGLKRCALEPKKEAFEIEDFLDFLRLEKRIDKDVVRDVGLEVFAIDIDK